MGDKDHGSLHDILRDDLRSITGSARDEDKGEAVPVDVALRTIAPRPIPSIVLSILAKEPQEVARQLAKIPEQLDDIVARYPVKIELRLDALSGFSERITAASLVFRLGVPLILTLRARREGGHSTATEPERQRFFLSMISALRQDPPPGSLIDVEAAAVAADPEGWGQVFSVAHERGFNVLLSHHDLDVTPEKAQALLPPEGLLDRTPGGGALLWKSATTVRTWLQDLAVLRALARGNTHQRRAAIMGMETATSRLLAPFFAAPLVYASIDAAHASAPGQLQFGDMVRVWTRWGIHVEDDGLVPKEDGLPPRWALIGRPAYHSLSPAMHNAAARKLGLSQRYFPLELPEHTGSGSASEVFRATLDTLPQLGVTGGNVTIPFKVFLAAVADRLESDARTLGAANTFRFDGDQLVAYNTDPEGVRGALATTDLDLKDTRVLVLGSGGAAASAVLAVREAASVIVANRTPEHAEAIRDSVHKEARIVDWAARSSAAADADLIINTTPIGMTGGPAPDESPLDAGVLRKDHTVLDMVYVPRRTPLLAAAEEAEATIIDGLEMLLYQGAASFRIWTDEEAPLDRMRVAMQEADLIPFPDRVRETVKSARLEA